VVYLICVFAMLVLNCTDCWPWKVPLGTENWMSPSSIACCCLVWAVAAAGSTPADPEPPRASTARWSAGGPCRAALTANSAALVSPAGLETPPAHPAVTTVSTASAPTTFILVLRTEGTLRR
jgi:hypothetical protein